MKIPRTMSTQHPDNVTNPFFSHRSILQGDDEIKEAFYAYSHLGVQEVMWDAEGKESDDFVIRKLMTDYKNFFQTKQIGRDVFLTIRIPNPDHEKTEAKILLETLESIPRSFDTARAFYGKELAGPPIFEVIVPLAEEKIIRKIYDYYKNVVIGKEKFKFMDRSRVTVGEWIGEFQPKTINVIPLFEDIPSILSADRSLEAYFKGKKLDHQRVFLARSDPAMNYSSVAVILALHLALEKLYALEKKSGVRIHPILGSGSAPFRGHLTPKTADYILSKYPSIATFTIQSAFKYDFPVTDVQRAIALMNETPVSEPHRVLDPKRAIAIIRKVSRAYQHQVQLLAPLVNDLAKFVPSRRMRKLHTGLFGYSRELKKGVTLPRVISFCAVLYSIGLPPDLLGLHVLNDEDYQVIHDVYSHFEEGLRETLGLWNPEVLEFVPSSIRKNLESVVKRFGGSRHAAHFEVSSDLLEQVRKQRFNAALTDLITQAGFHRGFLG